MNHVVTVTNREELLEAIEALKKQVLEWGYPVSVGASRSNGHGTLMAHCYPAGGSENVHGFVIRAMFEVDSGDLYISRELDNYFLDQKLGVSVESGTEITHLFHRGPHPNLKNGVSYINFGVRMTDDEATEMLLRDMTGVNLLRVNGPYSRAITDPDI